MTARRSAIVATTATKTVDELMSDFCTVLGNQFCADCLSKDPKWVAFPHGVIICEKCAGSHRSMGSHISQVKSILYDKWKTEMYQKLIKYGGNSKVNARLQKFCPRFDQLNPGSDSAEREQLIRNKYELKLYEKPIEKSEKEEALKRLAHYFYIISKTNPIMPEIESNYKAPEPDNHSTNPTDNDNDNDNNNNNDSTDTNTDPAAGAAAAAADAEHLQIHANDNNNTNAQKRKSIRRSVRVPNSIFEIEFESDVIYRYPSADFKAIPLPSRIFDFVFPEPIRLSEESQSAEHRSFVLTDAEGVRTYGISLIFWERISPMDILSMCEKLNKYRKENNFNSIAVMPSVVYSPKAIGLLSHWPFFRQFGEFLQTLYRITKTPSVPIPLERYVINFMHEVPVPPAGKSKVQFVVGDKSLTLKRAPRNSLPFCSVSGLNLFRCLSINNVLTFFNAVLQEQKIVLISKHLQLLTESAETISCLIFPFQITGVYMPLLPSKLLDFLHSPVPFMAGVHPSWLGSQTYDDLVFVYLDDDTMMAGAPLVPLPHRARSKLEKKLQELLPWHQSSPNTKKGRSNNNANAAANHQYTPPEISSTIQHNLELLPISNFLTSGSTIQENTRSNTNNGGGGHGGHHSKHEIKTEESIFIEIQDAFLRFFTSLFENYRLYLSENTSTDQYEFDKEAFLETETDKNSKSFFDLMLNTQLFMLFCQEREEILEQKAQPTDAIRLFDEKIVAKKSRSAFKSSMPTPFLSDRSLDLVGVFVANPPNSNDLDRDEYSYSSFPALVSSRFGRKREPNVPWKIINKKVHHQKRKSRAFLFAKGKHQSSQQTTSDAMQHLLAMQHAHKIEEIKSWDSFTENVFYLQHYVRGVLARKAFLARRAHIVRYQRLIKSNCDTIRRRHDFLERKQKAICLQSCFFTYLAKQRYQSVLYSQSITSLQAAIKSYLQHQKYQKFIHSVVVLQASVRTYTCLKRAQNKTYCVSILQENILCAIGRTNHLKTIRQISRCQAVLRGTLIRNQQKHHLQFTLNKLRIRLLKLWNDTFTSFMYRAKFWIVYESASYLNLAIHYEEISRLELLLHRLSKSAHALNESKERFELEKKELRRMLKTEIAPNIKNSLFIQNNISLKSKHKKLALIAKLFTDESGPKQSATTLLTICSSHSKSILDVTSQVELRRANRIKENLLMTVLNSMSSMQSLNRALQKQYKTNRKQSNTIKTLSTELARNRSIMASSDNKQRMLSSNLMSSSFNSNRKKYFSHNMSTIVSAGQSHHSSGGGHGGVRSSSRRYSEIRSPSPLPMKNNKQRKRNNNNHQNQNGIAVDAIPNALSKAVSSGYADERKEEQHRNQNSKKSKRSNNSNSNNNTSAGKKSLMHVQSSRSMIDIPVFAIPDNHNNNQNNNTNNDENDSGSDAP